MSAAFPPPIDDGGADHLARGLSMPDVVLPSTAGEQVSFAQRRGWTVVFIYPWTGRPGVANPPDWDTIPGAHGSTPQAEGFRNLHDAFREHGGEVFGLSVQAQDWQREFAKRLELRFPLVSDAALELQRALRLPTFQTGGVTYLKRLTLVLRDGRIERVFYPVHPPEAHAREALLWLEERVTRRPRG
jgi:peroxiredoxin